MVWTISLFIPLKVGRWSNLTHIFEMGLKPPTRIFLINNKWDKVPVTFWWRNIWKNLEMHRLKMFVLVVLCFSRLLRLLNTGGFRVDVTSPEGMLFDYLERSDRISSNALVILLVGSENIASWLILQQQLALVTICSFKKVCFSWIMG